MTNENPIDFIKNLKSEHKAIIATVHAIDTQVNGPNNLETSIEKLNRITDILFAHLEKEDKVLYPALSANIETRQLAKKYSYDMERLSCITLDFFKRYCVNREGLKIFLEDFINGYSLFKGLLTERIKREEAELYPAYILSESGVLHSEVLEYIQKKENRKSENEKSILIYGSEQHYLKALEIALEINGFKVSSTNSLEKIFSLAQREKHDLIILDITKSPKEINNLIMDLKSQTNPCTHLIGYSISDAYSIEERAERNLDGFIPQAAINIESLTNKIKQTLLNS